MCQSLESARGGVDRGNWKEMRQEAEGSPERDNLERVVEEGLSSQTALGSTLSATISSPNSDFSSFCFLVKWGRAGYPLHAPPASLSCSATRMQILMDCVSGLLSPLASGWIGPREALAGGWASGEWGQCTSSPGFLLASRVQAICIPLPTATHGFFRAHPPSFAPPAWGGEGARLMLAPLCSHRLCEFP